MSNGLSAIVEKLFSTPDLPALGEVIEAVQDTYGVDHVNYHAISLGLDAPVLGESIGGGMKDGAGIWRREGRALGAFSYSHEWIARYLECRYDLVDPVVTGAFGAFAAIDWGDLDWSSAPLKRFMHEATDFGIGNHGYTVPVRGPNGQFAMFTINKTCSNSEWESLLAAHASDFTMIAHYVHQQGLAFAAQGDQIMAGLPLRALSARERDAIGLIADGLSRGQAADKLGISENTFRVYIDSARHKLGALNIPHAVAIAAYRGVITPQ